VQNKKKLITTISEKYSDGPATRKANAYLSWSPKVQKLANTITEQNKIETDRRKDTQTDRQTRHAQIKFITWQNRYITSSSAITERPRCRLG